MTVNIGTTETVNDEQILNKKKKNKKQVCILFKKKTEQSLFYFDNLQSIYSTLYIYCTLLRITKSSNN